MRNLSTTKFALFFTRGLSLAKWDHLGMIMREIKIYQELATHLGHMYLFTYGVNEEQKYKHLFPENVTIISRPQWIPVILYSFLIPLIHKKILKKVDIMKTNQMDGSYAAVISKKLFRNKLIIRCGYEWLQFVEIAKRSFIKRSIAYLVEFFAYKNADAIVQTSVGARDFVIQRFGVAKEKLVLIPNYVNTDTFSPLPIPREKGRVIAVGRLEDQKNLFNLIEAFKGLSLHLVFVGKGSLKEALEDHAKKHVVSVEFKGVLPQTDIIKELSKSEIYILPSLYEGHPKTLIEAMSCGLPCIGSDVSGINDTIEDGKNGIICQTDVESIRRALVLLSGDTNLRETLGENARATIIGKYSFEKTVEKELSVYKSL